MRVRVVAGELRGRPLRAPAGARTRPTGELVRGALFAALEARWLEWGGAGSRGVRVLDLYAGSGALGIEALSRGAGRACFVEIDRGALAALAANLRSLGLDRRARVVERPVGDFLRHPDGEGPYGLILADPPYALGAANLLPALDSAAWLAPGGVCAIEHTAREELPEWSGTLQRVWKRVHGGTALSVYTAIPDRG